MSPQPHRGAADTPSMTRTVRHLAVLAVVALGGIAAGTGCARQARPTKRPQQAEAHVTRAMAAIEAGDLDRAEAELHLALEYAPGLATAHNGLGLVAKARGDRAAARFHFGRALQSNPDLAEAHSNLGALDVEDGQLHEATQHFYAALAIDPGYPAARHNLARTLLRAGDFGGARKQFLRLTSADETNADAWAELGLVEIAMNHRADADRAIRTALALDPTNVIALRARGDLARAGGDYEGALADYDAILSAHGSDTDALVARGVTYLVMGRYAPAVADLSRAVTLAPNNPAARFAYGAVLSATGDDEAAVGELEAAIQLRAAFGARFAEAHFMRAQALDRLGRRKPAIDAYKSFLAEGGEDPTLAEEAAIARQRIAELSVGR